MKVRLLHIENEGRKRGRGFTRNEIKTKMRSKQK